MFKLIARLASPRLASPRGRGALRRTCIAESLEGRTFLDGVIEEAAAESVKDVDAVELSYPGPPPLPVVSIASKSDGSEDPADISDPSTGPVGVEYTVSRSGGTTSDLSVFYEYAGGTAVPGDFTNPSGGVLIPAGSSSAVLKLLPIDDHVLEPTETAEIRLTLAPYPNAYTFQDPANPPKAPGNVADNDYVIKAVEIGFDSQTIKKDDGSGDYTKPQWLDANGDGDAAGAGEKRYPISYVRSRPNNDTRVTVEPKFTVDGKLNGKYLIFGGGVGMAGAVSFEKEVIVAAGSTVLETSITSSGALGSNIDFGTLAINWRITHLGQDTAYQSGHRTYVTGAPASGHFETVLWMGCSGAKGERPAEAGELDPGASGANQQVMDGIWNTHFKGRGAKDVAGNPLRFWGPDTPNNDTTAELLKFKDGSCGAWTRLLMDVVTAQGLVAERNVIEAPKLPGDEEFNVYRDHGFTVDPLAPAQGGVPVRHRFEDHAVVTFSTEALGTRIYDPSYGGDPFGSRIAWEDATVVQFITRYRNAANETMPFFLDDPKGTLETIWS